MSIDLNKLSMEEKKAYLILLQEDVKRDESRKRDAFEAIRQETILEIKQKFMDYLQHGKDFKKWLCEQAETYYGILADYGKLKRKDQIGYDLSDDDFRMKVKGNRVKKFDERADVAEKRLVDFLNKWIKEQDGGGKNPMYKLAMAMIQRNENGDLDYKSISRLYDLEDDFNNAEYTEIMNLFRESNIVEGTSINFYFEIKDKYNNWHKQEPSFNRINP